MLGLFSNYSRGKMGFVEVRLSLTRRSRIGSVVSVLSAAAGVAAAGVFFLPLAVNASDLVSANYRLRGGHINAGALTAAASTEASPQIGSVGASLGQINVGRWIVGGLDRGTAGFWAGATSTDEDQDNDSIVDEFDNCTLTFNPLQRDTDGDGCGNYCDGDYNQDGIVGGPDFTIFAYAFGAGTPGNPGFNTNADVNGDSIVGGPDYTWFAIQFGDYFPGPSLRVDRDPIACP